MPYMIGRAPIRRTLRYLEAGKLILNQAIKVMNIHFNHRGDHHTGIKEFVFWHLPQIQYKNPNVQIVLMKNLTPSPFIRCFYDNGREMLIDVDSKNKDDILQHCIKVIGKSKKELEKERMAQINVKNPSWFGVECDRSCICEVFGQVPCPDVCPVPKHLRGKYKKEL